MCSALEFIYDLFFRFGSNVHGQKCRTLGTTCVFPKVRAMLFPTGKRTRSDKKKGIGAMSHYWIYQSCCDMVLKLYKPCVSLQLSFFLATAPSFLHRTLHEYHYPKTIPYIYLWCHYRVMHVHQWLRRL